MTVFLPEMELALGADLTAQPSTWAWWNYTDHVFKLAKVTWTWGRQDRYRQVPAARVGLTLLNPGGIWVPDNAASALYGLIDVDTPLRILNRALATNVADTFARTAASSWGTADTGGTWTNTGGAAGDYSVATASGGRHTHSSATVPHYSTQAVSLTRIDITVRVRVNALSTGAAQTAGIVCRWVDANNSRRGEIQFGVGATVAGRVISRSGGTDTVVATVASTLTHVAATWYRIRLQTGNTSVRLKVWIDGTTEPRNWLIDGANAAAFLSPVAGPAGVYSIRETGNTNASATTDFDDFSLADGPFVLSTLHVDGWPTEWSDHSGVQALAPITASGALDRITNAKTLKSAAFRSHTLGQFGGAPAVVGYWSMEDASGSTQFASGLTGGPPMAFTDMSPAADSSIAGSDPLPTGGGTATFYAVVPTYPATGEWGVRAVMKFPTQPSVPTAVFAWTTGGTITKWAFVISPGGTWALQGYSGITEVLGAPGGSFTDPYGASLHNRQLYLAVNAVQNGANIDYDLTLYVDTTITSMSGSFAGTIGNVSRILHSAYPGYTAGGYTFGHVAVGSDTTYTAAAASFIANGYAGETTDTRLARLGFEENVPTFFGEILGAGAGTTSQEMGPQRTTALINLYREVEATESGILFDGRQGQLTILPRRQRGNHTVDLVLDVAQGHVGWPLRRTIDRQLVANDVTVTSTTGSKAYASDPVSVRKIGVKPAQVSVNTHLDSELDDHARWWLHVGLNREARYPQIPLDLARNPGLIASYLAADIGSRASVVNPPGELPPDPLDLTIEGGVDVMDDHSWLATINYSPGSIWDLWTVGDTLRGRTAPSRVSTGVQAGQSAAQLLTAATSGATSMLFATLEGRPWSTTATPYHTKIAGEKVTVTAMANGTPTLRAAGAASHGDNASLTPALPAGAILGDLLLIFAAIRNTAGTITTPAGYTVLATVGHVAVFGKTHSGTESAPTIAFAGGAAGDTTSAQMAAFPFTQCRALYTASQTNGSAANIAIPAMLPPRHRVLALWLGWKQDDWTSVATLFGAEIGEPSTTTGNDQGLVWDYQYQAIAAETAASSFVVTGGAAAVSKGLVLVLPGDVQTATVTRAVNAVAKAQLAGAEIELWKPGVLAL